LLQKFSQTNKKHILWAFIAFFLSTIITWWFIKQSNLYQNQSQEILSCSIAGGKWCLQILLAIVFLKEKKWSFILGSSLVCLVGSVILIPYCLFLLFDFPDSPKFFVGSLMLAVLSMLFCYYQTVKKIRLDCNGYYFLQSHFV
jgi:phosphotransferase system  glucose/maltose/N-acetylglucosamine-specific IIC component